MTTAVKEKKPFLPQRKNAVVLSSAGGAPSASVANRGNAAPANLVVGGEPRVHLLPADVAERKNLRVLKRRLAMALVAAVVLVGAGYGLETFNLSSAQTQLQTEQATTAQLLAKQAQFSEVTKVQSDIAAIQAGQTSGTTQEILWAPFIKDMQATLPAGASIISFLGVIDLPSASGAPAAAVPLQGPRIATVNVTVSIAQGDVPGWLTALPKLKGYVDASPSSLTAPAAGSGVTNYTLILTMHLDEKAHSTPFTKAAGTTK
jgi:hypothetical protein